MPRNFVTSRYSVSLSGYAVLNASRTATNDFDIKECSRTNTRSAREYTMFAPAQLLRKRFEQRPSKQDDLDSSFTGKVGRVLHGGGPASGFMFVPWNVIVVGLRSKW
jgi:hypothetical protein